MKVFPLSLQETFNLAYSGVVNQGAPCAYIWSKFDPPICVYVGEDGKHCAAGHVFKSIEPEYDLKEADNIGGKSARQVLADMKYIEWNQPMPEFALLLTRIQKAHDGSVGFDFLNSFKATMSKVAKDFGLEVSNA